VELLYRFEGRLGEPTVVGPVSEGLRLDVPFEGAITDGLLAGGRGRGIDYIRLRPDGVWIIDARDVIEAPGGHVHAHARGYVLPPAGAGAPDLQAILDPAFRPPDVRLAIRAAAICETGVPSLAYLNRTVVAVEGWVNNGTGELVFEGRAMPAVGAAAAIDAVAGTR